MGLLSDLWNKVTGFDAENAARAELADRQLAVSNRELYDRGVWNWDKYQLAEEQRKSGPNTTDPVAVAQQTMADFQSGLGEGLAAEQLWFKKTTTGLLGGVFGFVPWWAWVVGAGYLAWRLGWLRKLKAQ